mgnify:CR=1 FL=1
MNGGPITLEARKCGRTPSARRLALLLGLKPRPIRKASYTILSEAGELRIAPRLRVRLRYGTICDLRLRALAECAVQDVSATGARLLVPPRVLLPTRFNLVEDEGRAVSPVALVWRRGSECGVRRLSRNHKTADGGY